MNQPMRVLLVADSPQDHTSVRQALAQSPGQFELSVAGGLAALEAHLSAGAFDLALIGFSGASPAAWQALTMMQSRLPAAPVVLLADAGAFSVENAIAAMKAGAADFVLNAPAQLERLPQLLLAAQEWMQQHTQTGAQLRYQASLIEAASDAIISTDNEFIIRTWNRGAETMYGWTADEVIGRPVSAVIPTNYPRQDRQQVLQQFRAHGYWQGEVVQRRKDGRTIEVLCTSTIVHDQDGQPSGVVAMNRDISQWVSAEADVRLLQSAAHAISAAPDFHTALQAALRTICEATGWDFGEVWLPNADGSALELNSAYYCRLPEIHRFRQASEGTTFAPDEGLPGRVWISQRPEWVADVSINGEVFLRAASALTDGFHSGLCVPAFCLGRVFAVVGFFSLTPRPCDLHLIETILGVLSQLCLALQRKQAEDAARQEQMLSNTILDSLPGVFYLFDEHGRFLRWNHNFERVIGYSPAEIAQIQPTDLFEGADKTLIAERIALVLAAGAADAEAYMVSKHGERTPFYFTGVRVQLGSITCVTGMGIDISQRKRIEEQMRLLATISLAVSQAADFDTALRSTLQTICQETGWVFGEAWVFDADKMALTPGPVWHDGTPALVEFEKASAVHTFAYGVGMPGRVWATGRSVWVWDVTRHPNFPRAAAAQRAGLHGAVAIPILAGQEVVAVMDFFVCEPRAEDKRLERLIATVGSQLGVVFQRKQVEDASLRQLQELSILHAVAVACAAADDVDELIESVTETIGRALYPDHFGVLLLDAARSHLTAHHSYRGVDAETRRAWPAISLSQGVIGQVVRSGLPHRVPDVQQEPIYWEVSPHTRSELCVPLKIGDDVIGVINAESVRLDAFGPGDERLLLTIAGQLATAIARLRLFDETRRRVEELSAVAQVSAALRVARTRAQISTIILDQVQALFEMDGSALAMRDPDGDTTIIEAARGSLLEAVGVRIPSGVGVSEEIIASGQPYVNPDVYSDPRAFGLHYHGASRAVAGIPLKASERVIGVLWVGRRSPVTPSEVQLLTAIADIAANAIRRTTLFEKTLFQAEQITQIMRSVPDGVLLLDGQQRLLLANPAAQDALTFLAGAQVGDIVQRLGDRTLDELLTAPPAGRWHEVHKERRVFEAMTRPLPVEGPGEGGWVMALREISERLLIQQQLQQQERLAAVGQLAAGIAHDFNNLLGVIILYAQLLAPAVGANSRDRQRLAVIIEQAERGAQMIRQILDFSRRAALARQPLSLRNLVSEQTALLQQTVPENIEVCFVCPTADEHLVKADLTRLQQALMNLALNARDAMPHGGRLTFDLDQVQVDNDNATLFPGLAPGHWVCLAVSDTGAGIPPEVQDHIFEPFFTTKSTGTGLGLAQVHGIVHQHGGQITVASQVGHGTVFTIYLPTLAAAGEPAPETAAIASAHGQGERVLVVEDNGPLRLALAHYLRQQGYDPLEAANGEEALELLTSQSDPVALILSDVVMPRLGGVGLVHALRARGWTQPVIFMTGHPMDEAELTPLRAQGLHAWLLKPLDLKQLAQAIYGALHR